MERADPVNKCKHNAAFFEDLTHNEDREVQKEVMDPDKQHQDAAAAAAAFLPEEKWNPGFSQ